MELQKINVKIFTRDAKVPLADFIPVFHSWIQATDGEYHDVADYSHIDGGPGILLVAHEANISVDEQGGNRGLLFNQKQPIGGCNHDKLCGVLQQALSSCQRLVAEPSLAGHLEFRGDRVMVLINDRLRAPNTTETLDELREDLQAIGVQLFGSTEFAVRHVDNPDHRFAVHLESPVELKIDELCANVGTV